MIMINNSVFKSIIEHARKDFPLEACGYLAGKNRIISKHYEMRNIDKSRKHYSFSPEEQFKVLRESRNAGLELLAVYHSHPESPARMSNEDIKLARDPDISYVIVSLIEDAKIRAFRVKNRIITEEKLEVVE